MARSTRMAALAGAAILAITFGAVGAGGNAQLDYKRGNAIIAFTLD